MKAPAFQLYPQDFISSLDCQIMPLEEFGAYNWLLYHSWTQEPQGHLPNNHEILARLLRINPRTFSKMWRNSLEKKFKISEDGKSIYNERLAAEAKKQTEFREKQALNGIKGGRPPKSSNPNETQENPSLSTGLTQTEPKKSSSTSSTSSSTSNKETNKESFFNVFVSFRKDYPGSKRGDKTEFDNFCKKHSDWMVVLPLLSPSLDRLIKHMEALKAASKFVPEWPNLQTFINQRRWETEVGQIATPPPPEDKQATAFKTLEEKDEFWGGRNYEFKPQMQ